MLSYQHAYHAGNHADILKHLVLTGVLASLKKKEKAFTYFDSHAASGLYDFLDSRAEKTGESLSGIQLLLQHKNQLMDYFSKDDFSGSLKLLSDYFSLIEKYSSKGFYPGSPEIGRLMLRSQDFMLLSELHPVEIENLRHNMLEKTFCPSCCTHIQIHKRNGYEMLGALTPPQTRRGVVLIDPSYEEVSDYKEAASTISRVNKKWSNGIIMLWYPLLAHRENEINQMLEEIKYSVTSVNANTEITDLRLEVAAKDSHREISLKELKEVKDGEKNPPRLYGSGMLVINSPWRLKEDMEALIPVVEKILKGEVLD